MTDHPYNDAGRIDPTIVGPPRPALNDWPIDPDFDYDLRVNWDFVCRAGGVLRREREDKP